MADDDVRRRKKGFFGGGFNRIELLYCGICVDLR